MLLRKCIATSLALFLAAAAYAAPVATVAQVDGTLLVRKADGKAKVLARGSAVEQGDTLLAEPESYATIRFAAGEITLQPDSQLRIDAPASFTLSKGGLRGSGNFNLDTPEGKVEVRGTAIIDYAPGKPAQAAFGRILLASLDGLTLSDAPLQLAQLTVPVPGAKAPGLYVQVLDGIIHLSNGGGSQSFAAGQFGYTASFVKPPVVLPANPGMQFTPPPSFSQTSTANSASNSSGKSGSVDCEVR